MNMMQKQIGIRGLGVGIPKKKLTNADFEKMVDTTDEWIVSRTGIHERYVITEDEFPTDIAAEAARKAIDDAGMTPDQIDGIIYCTYTPDYVVPSSACILQKKLNIPSCVAFDLNAACTGFVYGLQTAYAHVRAGLAKNVLLVACDCVSRFIDYTDRSICVLFGDGAGAVVVGEVPEGRGILSNFAGANGDGSELIIKRLGGAAHPASPDNIGSPEHYMQMNGRQVFKFAVNVVNEALERGMEMAGIKIDDVDLLVPHQANVRIIRSAMERFGFKEESVVINMDKFGNTSSASIPIALETARKEGRLKEGTTCALVAFGAGLTYGSTIIKW